MKILVRALLISTLAGSVIAAEGGKAFLGVILGSDDAAPTLQSVVQDGPAAHAGLKSGDRVLAIDGQSVATTADLRAVLRTHGAGDKLTFQVERDGAAQTVAVTLGEQSEGKAVSIPSPSKSQGGAVGSGAIEVKPQDPSGSGVVALGPARVPQTATVKVAPPSIATVTTNAAGGFLGVYLEDAEQGALVTNVVSGSPAEAAGIKTDDIITAVGEHRVGKAADLRSALSAASAGDQVQIKLKRGDQTMTVVATLGAQAGAGIAPPVAEPSKPADAKAEPAKGQRAYLGVSIDGTSTGAGVKIASVTDDGPAAKAGLQAGDVITSLDRKETAHLDALMQALAQHHAGDSVRVGVKRGDGQLSLRVRLGSRPEEEAGEAAKENEPEARAEPQAPAKPGKQATEPKRPAKRGSGAAPGFLGVFCAEGEAGATVQDVVGGSPAEHAGLQQGDVIVAVGGTAVHDHDELTKAIRSHHAGDAIDLKVNRGGESLHLKATLGAAPEAEAQVETVPGEAAEQAERAATQAKRAAERAERQARQQAERARAQAERAEKLTQEQAERAEKRAQEQAERQQQRAEEMQRRAEQEQREAERRAREQQGEEQQEKAPAEGAAPRAFLGVVPDTSFDGDGLRVQEVVQDSPAQKHGLRAGDVIVRIDRRAIRNTDDVFAALREHEPGDTVGVRVQRGEETVRVRVTLGERQGGAEQGEEQEADEKHAEQQPERPHGELKKQPREHGGGGAYLGVQLGDEDGGAHVASLVRGSPADQAGLRDGDVITRVDGQPIGSADDLVNAIASQSPGTTVKLRVRRDGKSQTISVTLGHRKDTQAQSMLEVDQGDEAVAIAGDDDAQPHALLDALALPEGVDEVKVDDLVAGGDDDHEPKIDDLVVTDESTGSENDADDDADDEGADDEGVAVFTMTDDQASRDDDCDRDDDGRCDDDCNGHCGEGCDDDQCEATCTEADDEREADDEGEAETGDGQEIVFDVNDEQAAPAQVMLRRAPQGGERARVRFAPPAPPAAPAPAAPRARYQLVRPQGIQVTAPRFAVRLPRAAVRAMPARCGDDCSPRCCACNAPAAAPAARGFARVAAPGAGAVQRLRQQIERLQRQVRELRARLGDRD
ncbi:MAG: PDZ domain-containing protein, partial [Planctomycetota bacterium]